MDTELLKTFLEVYKTRHFGKAAENLFLTQSAVSARIKQLEQELGNALFVRNKNNIQPTVAGERLLLHAESILKSWNRIKLDLAVEQEDKTKLVMAATPGLWDSYVNRWLKNFINSHNDVLISCESLNNETIYRRLLDGSIDIAFTYDLPNTSRLESLKTIPISYVMVSSYKGLDVNEAFACNYHYVDWGAAFANEHATMYPDIPAPRIWLSMGSLARYLIRHCGGTAYLPASLVKTDLEKEKLFRVNNANRITREAYMVINPDNERLSGYKTFLGK